MQLLTQPLGKLATQISGATRVFHQYKLDFCCGGQQSLAEALHKRGLETGPVLAALQALQQKPLAKDWRQAPANELIDYILQRYHDKHRQQLPELIRLARRVEQVHGDSPDCPTGLADHLDAMLQELESHMQKEEQILFPMLRQGIYPAGPIHVMQQEHLQHGDELAKLDELTDEIRLPPGACNTWTALYLGLRELKEELMEHIVLENEILFVQPSHGDGICCGSCQ